MSWKILEERNPELAAFGAERLNGKVAYLATIRKDGSPRVHPMTPIIGQGHLFVFTDCVKTAPKSDVSNTKRRWKKPESPFRRGGSPTTPKCGFTLAQLGTGRGKKKKTCPISAP